MADDLPPPLEDMTEQLSLRSRMHGKTTPNKAAIPAAAGSQESTQHANHGKAAAAKTKASASSASASTKPSTTKSKFGGLSKGFLSGSPSKKPQPKPQPKLVSKPSPSSEKEEMPFIQAKPEAKGQLPEVQEAMKQAMPFMEQTKDRWMTPELLKKFQTKPHLVKCLADPRFMEALNEFQTDPATAKKKYGQDQEVTLFFKEYFEVMGDHFAKLAEEDDAAKATQPAPVNEDEQRLQEIMKDPDVQEALNHPNVKQLIETLKLHPERSAEITHAVMRDPVMARHVKTLYNAGLLGVAS